MFVFKSIIILL